MSVTPSIAEMRAFALARSLGKKTDLLTAIQNLGYVQADPIRSPARAQDLILMQRVRNYTVGHLERLYPKLGIEEDMLQNYGFVPREVHRLLHPRHSKPLRIETELPGLSELVHSFVVEKGAVHPRDVDDHFSHGTVTNYWGGNSSATTRILDGLHYRGKLRIQRRDKGIRVYTAADHHAAKLEDTTPEQQARELVQLLLKQYAPIPSQSLGYLVSLSGYGAPHLKTEMHAAFKNLAANRVKIDGFTYLWPEDEDLQTDFGPRKVKLLTPFDPIVWDRRRFEHLHGWPYRFEAYTPAAKRQFGYYALPLLWGAEAVGWANLKVENGELKTEIGFVNGGPKSKTFERELEAELGRYRSFLGLEN